MAVQTLLSSDTFLVQRDKINANMVDLDNRSVTFYTFADSVSMFASAADVNDIAIRVDLGEIFIHNGGAVGDITDWTHIGYTVTQFNNNVNAISSALAIALG